MEGGWRALVAWLAATLAGCALIAGASGCGGDDDDPRAESPAGVQTTNPLRTFAPLVEVAADEPWRPMSGRWFIERSVFRFAEDDGCPDRKIAVGHTMPEQQNPEIDWIYPKGLGGWSWPAYFRNPFDAKCELDFDLRFYADQLTRPHDPGVRVEGIRPGEGFYLDLVDEARGGPVMEGDLTEPVYAERTAEGDAGVRLTYWMLFGMHGTPGEPDAHEGDWQRVDVLLHDAGDDRYEPLAVQVGMGEQKPVDTAWGAARHVDGTHPVVAAARGSHAMTPSRREQS
ncbi:MAG: hypothetical protein M3N56_14825, partial [Actinomycetota bacterium]|nr:hypothetical protein [Actinomycetota bacterium]